MLEQTPNLEVFKTKEEKLFVLLYNLCADSVAACIS